MRNEFKKKIFYAVIMLCALCAFGKEQKAYAARNNYVDLKTEQIVNSSKTYEKYDVTGDQKADKLEISIERVGETKNDGRLCIYINDKLAYESLAADYMFWNIGLVYLENGKVFFDIRSMVGSDDLGIHMLYEYKNGELECSCDFLEYYNRHANYYDVSIYKVGSNTIYVKAHVQFFTTGNFLSYNMKYKYKDGGIQRVSTVHTILYGQGQRNKWTANRSIKVYENPGSKKVIYTLKKKDVIRINKVVYKGRKIYFQIKDKRGKGKTGYIPAADEYPDKLYFLEAKYSG